MPYQQVLYVRVTEKKKGQPRNNCPTCTTLVVGKTACGFECPHLKEAPQVSIPSGEKASIVQATKRSILAVLQGAGDTLQIYARYQCYFLCIDNLFIFNDQHVCLGGGFSRTAPP